MKRFPDLPQAFAGGDEIKIWVKLSTGVEMSACPYTRTRLKANEGTPSEWVPNESRKSAVARDVALARSL